MNCHVKTHLLSLGWSNSEPTELFFWHKALSQWHWKVAVWRKSILSTDYWWSLLNCPKNWPLEFGWDVFLSLAVSKRISIKPVIIKLLTGQSHVNYFQHNVAKLLKTIGLVKKTTLKLHFVSFVCVFLTKARNWMNMINCITNLLFSRVFNVSFNQ